MSRNHDKKDDSLDFACTDIKETLNVIIYVSHK